VSLILQDFTEGEILFIHEGGRSVCLDLFEIPTHLVFSP
jgi:hypothetical protein